MTKLWSQWKLRWIFLDVRKDFNEKEGMKALSNLYVRLQRCKYKFLLNVNGQHKQTWCVRTNERLRLIWQPVVTEKVRPVSEGAMTGHSDSTLNIKAKIQTEVSYRTLPRSLPKLTIISYRERSAGRSTLIIIRNFRMSQRHSTDVFALSTDFHVLPQYVSCWILCHSFWHAQCAPSCMQFRGKLTTRPNEWRLTHPT